MPLIFHWFCASTVTKEARMARPDVQTEGRNPKFDGHFDQLHKRVSARIFFIMASSVGLFARHPVLRPACFF